MSQQRKLAIEEHVASYFSGYMAGRGLPLTNPRAGDALLQEPDVIFSSPGGPVGLEVTTLLPSIQAWRNLEATIAGHPEQSTAHVAYVRDCGDLAQRAPNSRRRTELDRRQRERRGLSLIQPEQPSDRLIQLGREQLAEKATKAYCVATYLVLDASENAIVTARYGQAIVDALPVPQPSPFVGVFLALPVNHSDLVDFLPLR